MSFIDVVIDMLKPDTVDSVEKIYKVAKRVSKKSPEKDADALRSILKKGWVEASEKQVKNDVKRMNAALKIKLSLPVNSIDKLEQKVIAAYKKDHKKGLAPSKCKATHSAIKDLVREISRYENALKEFAKDAFKAKAIADPLERNYKVRKDTAVVLRDALAKMTKYAFFTAYQGEMATYMLQCKDLAKYLSEAQGCTKKLGVRAKKEATNAVTEAKMTKEQLQYTSGPNYWEDLEGRIS